ncbi:MAG: sigma-70 family RNA polymerase sigma factor [Candidatus Omnitrophica bacterium]|nr:sigma-70 family RNA polymerase sigma factor [Candidatus Omnitrophota bacterium]
MNRTVPLIGENEKDLIRKAKSGDKYAYEQLVCQYYPRLYSYLFRLTGNHEDAEDILQEALSQAFTHIHQFRGGSLFSTWLYRIAINDCSKAFRQRNLTVFKDKVPLRQEHSLETDGVASVDLASQEPDAAKNAEENEVKQKVRLAISGLPLNLAEVITLRELESLTYNEIAERLGIAYGTVMSRLFRARLRLARLLRKQGLNEI